MTIKGGILLLIPAIDLKEGRCVRLRQGDMEQSQVFSDDPVATARHWQHLGCQRLHLVDLDGAVAGAPVHAPLIAAILKACPGLSIQVGGGVRTMQSLESYLKAGVDFVIIGTQAVKEPGFIKRACAAFGRHIIAGLDARDGRVAIDGWTKNCAQIDAIELARRFAEEGAVALIHTDIQRDGMLSGVNLDATQEMASALDIPIIASGGLASVDEVKKLKKIQGVSGVIAGRALYEGQLDFKAAKALCDEELP